MKVEAKDVFFDLTAAAGAAGNLAGTITPYELDPFDRSHGFVVKRIEWFGAAGMVAAGTSYLRLIGANEADPQDFYSSLPIDKHTIAAVVVGAVGAATSEVLSGEIVPAVPVIVGSEYIIAQFETAGASTGCALRVWGDVVTLTGDEIAQSRLRFS